MSTKNMSKPSYLINQAATIFLGVDWQIAFGEVLPVPHLGPALESVRAALAAWRDVKGRVILTKHIYKTPEEVGRIEDFIPDIFDLLSVASPFTDFHPGIYSSNDTIVRKTRFNALEGTTLEDKLKKQGVRTLIVAGLTTPICVQTTVDALMMRGFQVIVIADACASQPIGPGDPSSAAQAAHDAAIERMRYLFAEVITTNEFVVRVNSL